MISKVKRLEPVLRGEAFLVEKRRLRPNILAEYSRTQPSVNRRLMIPKHPSEKVRMRRGLPELEREIGRDARRRIVQRRVILPVNIHNLDEFIADLRRRPDFYAASRGDYPPWVFGFTVFGNRSHQLFIDPELLAEYLERYTEIDDVEDGWENFILYALDSENMGPWAGQAARKPGRGRRSRKARNRAGYKMIDHRIAEQKRRAAQSEDARNAERKRNADQHRERRRKLASSGRLTQRGTKRVRPVK